MKKSIITIALLFIVVVAAIGQTDTENYTHTTTFKVPVQNNTESVSSNDKIESATYYDGLGRPIQTIAVKAGGNGENLVTHIEYDALGRTLKQYLPLATEGDVLNPLDIMDQTILKNSTHSFYYTPKYEYTYNPYSEVRYEASPLNRVLEQGAPGNSWALYHDPRNRHIIRFDHQVNIANEVRYFEAYFAGNDTKTPSLRLNGYYKSNELYKSVTKDENWRVTSGNDHTTEEFTNKLGQVVLKRTYDNNVAHDTYYVYDDFGNLSYVLPPKASILLVSTRSIQIVLDDLCYQYKYDHRNRLIEKKIPGKGEEYIVYNKLDQPILTQDANQRAKIPMAEWLFTKYDAFGRVAYTGLINHGATRQRLQEIADRGAYTQFERKATTAITVGGTQVYYSNTAAPTAITEVLTVNYYDDYVDTEGMIVPDMVYNQSTTKATSVATTTVGLPTVSKVRVLGTNDWITSITGYDHKIRPIYVETKNNYLETHDSVKNRLDFIGNLLESTTTHLKNGHAPITITDRFAYDHQNRLLTQLQQIDNEDVELITSNSYDELGQLEDKRVGGKLNQTASHFTDIVGIEIDGGTITKTNRTGWVAGLASIGEISGDGYISYEMPQNNKNIMVGLSSDNSSASYATIDFAIYTRSGTSLAVYESGVFKGNFGTYKAGDIFEVERIGRTIRYKKNEIVFYTSKVTSTGTLIGDISMYTIGGEILNLEISSDLRDQVNVVQSLDGSIKKTNAAGWTAGMATVNSIKGDGYLEFSPTRTTDRFMAGLSTDNTNTDFRTIDYAIYIISIGTIRVYESGVFKGHFGNYGTSDTFKVERIGTTVYYKKNDKVFYTSKVSSTGNLIGDASLYDANTVIDYFELHNSGLQKVDYQYNVRGWLTDINDVDNLDNDLFSFRLSYDVQEGQVQYANLYNGNISQSIWKTANTDKTKRGYSYKYDALNRIELATMRKGEDLNIYMRNHLRKVTYDKNGNILTLVRDNASNIMDDLTYTYNGNKLLQVNDLKGAAYPDEGYVDRSDSNYAYDVNGNLITDPNKGITRIKYNHLNLPTEISLNPIEANNDGVITYVYDATGVKLKKIVNPNNTAVDGITQYAGGYIYENNNGNERLAMIAHPEGYIEPDGNNFKYVYQYKDHLGNVRLTYADSDGDGAIDPSSEIISEKNYYPFGLEHKGYNNVVNGTEHPYKYNGMEHQEELGLNTYDFGARNYDPALGRWMNVDPLAENSRRWTPYNFAYNNPIYFIDPDGMQATDWYRDSEGAVVYDASITSQDDLDKAGIEGEYIAESFTAKDQNNDIFVFNEDGTVTDSDATVGMMEGAGIDTSSMVEVTSTMVDDGKNGVTEASLAAGAFLVADDATVIGAVDDVLLPFVAIAALVGTLAETAPTFSFAKDSSKNERHGDAGAMGKVEQQIAELEGQLANATGKAAKKIKQKIQNVKRNAAKNKKGETHSRNAKGN